VGTPAYNYLFKFKSLLIIKESGFLIENSRNPLYLDWYRESESLEKYKFE
jgi:hypothetical protein